MKLPVKITFVLLTVLVICYSCMTDVQKSEDTPAQDAMLSTSEASSDGLSDQIPLEVSVTQPVSLASLQDDFDEFSWKTFIALNWPAKADGTPDPSLTIGEHQEGPTVWQSWKSSRDIFLANGAKPLGWDEADPVPAPCSVLSNGEQVKGTLHLTQVGKTPGVLDESGEPFETGPLIDQNGQYTRYGILTNRSMFDYIVDTSPLQEA